MKIIDGSFGEGGGQIFRSALSLAMCSQTPVRIENIRAGRKKPGLLRQHLACLRASQEICNASVSGGSLGSACVEFTPGKIRGGTYRYAIGSAGSTTLVFQTILPALLLAEGESQVLLEGGTHNPAAPSFEFIQNCFLPLLKRMNINVETKLERYGFYPNGGGAWTARIQPAINIYPLKLKARGELENLRAVALFSAIPEHVAERELAYAQRKLKMQNIEIVKQEAKSFGPGNLFSLQARFASHTEVFDSVGTIGLTAERVAGRAVREFKRLTANKAIVGEYLCDQMLLPMVLGQGGTFLTIEPSLHTRTNIEVIRSFLNCDISLQEIEQDLFEVIVRP